MTPANPAAETPRRLEPLLGVVEALLLVPFLVPVAPPFLVPVPEPEEPEEPEDPDPEDPEPEDPESEAPPVGEGPAVAVGMKLELMQA